MLRPALAAGVAVVMMETLTDFATVQYFGVDTVSVGVFRIWRGTFDRDAASEFATLVLVVALMIIGLERIMRGRARFGEGGWRCRRPGPSSANQAQGLACLRALLVHPPAVLRCTDAPTRLVDVRRGHRPARDTQHRTLP